MEGSGNDLDSDTSNNQCYVPSIPLVSNSMPSDKFGVAENGQNHANICALVRIESVAKLWSNRRYRTPCLA
jgi:hypothetical protein